MAQARAVNDRWSEIVFSEGILGAAIRFADRSRYVLVGRPLEGLTEFAFVDALVHGSESGLRPAPKICPRTLASAPEDR